MPRIEAPTVAEHHARRRQRILDSAEQLFAERGIRDVAMAEIAEHAGLRRNSLYRYFESRDALAIALFERDVPDYLIRCDAILSTPEPALSRLLAWADYQLTYTADPRHAVGNRVLADAGSLSPEAMATIRTRHEQVMGSIKSTIAEHLAGRNRRSAQMLTDFVVATTLAASRLAVQHGATPTLRQTLRRTLMAILRPDDG